MPADPRFALPPDRMDETDETFHRLGTIGRAATLLLGAAAVTHLLSTISDWHTYHVVRDFLGGKPDVDDAKLNSADTIARLTSIPNVAISVAAAVVFVLWLWRARLNSEVFCKADHRHGHGWVLGAWICPGPNLVYPKQIVDDVWAASDKRTPPGTENLSKYKRPPLIMVWWVCWVGAMLLDVVLRRVLMWIDPTVGSLRITALAGTVALVLTIVSAVLATLVIRGITSMQDNRPWVAWWDVEESQAPQLRRLDRSQDTAVYQPMYAGAGVGGRSYDEPALASSGVSGSSNAKAQGWGRSSEPTRYDDPAPTLVGLPSLPSVPANPPLPTPAATPAPTPTPRPASTETGDEKPVWTPFASVVQGWQHEQPAPDPSDPDSSAGSSAGSPSGDFADGFGGRRPETSDRGSSLWPADPGEQPWPAQEEQPVWPEQSAFGPTSGYLDPAAPIPSPPGPPLTLVPPPSDAPSSRIDRPSGSDQRSYDDYAYGRNSYDRYSGQSPDRSGHQRDDASYGQGSPFDRNDGYTTPSEPQRDSYSQQSPYQREDRPDRFDQSALDRQPAPWETRRPEPPADRPYENRPERPAAFDPSARDERPSYGQDRAADRPAGYGQDRPIERTPAYGQNGSDRTTDRPAAFEANGRDERPTYGQDRPGYEQNGRDERSAYGQDRAAERPAAFEPNRSADQPTGYGQSRPAEPDPAYGQNGQGRAAERPAAFEPNGREDRSAFGQPAYGQGSFEPERPAEPAPQPRRASRFRAVPADSEPEQATTQPAQRFDRSRSEQSPAPIDAPRPEQSPGPEQSPRLDQAPTFGQAPRLDQAPTFGQAPRLDQAPTFGQAPAFDRTLRDDRTSAPDQPRTRPQQSQRPQESYDQPARPFDQGRTDPRESFDRARTEQPYESFNSGRTEQPRETFDRPSYNQPATERPSYEEPRERAERSYQEPQRPSFQEPERPSYERSEQFGSYQPSSYDSDPDDYTTSSNLLRSFASEGLSSEAPRRARPQQQQPEPEPEPQEDAYGLPSYGYGDTYGSSDPYRNAGSHAAPQSRPDDQTPHDDEQTEQPGEEPRPRTHPRRRWSV